MAALETRKSLLTLLAAVLALASADALAQVTDAVQASTQSSFDVSLRSASPLFGSTQSIVVSGSAPSDCVPGFDRLVQDENGLSIHLKRTNSVCAATSMRKFRIPVDFSQIAGEALAPMVHPTWIWLDDNPQVRLVAFALLDASDRNTAPIPENGFWWSQPTRDDAALAGSGVSFDLQSGRLAASLLSFDAVGDSSWQFGSAPLSGRVADIPLVRLVRGDPPFMATGTRPLAEPGPRLAIDLTGPSTAHAWLIRPRADHSLEVRSLELARSPFMATPPGGAWSGRWVLVRDDDTSADVYNLSGFSMIDAETFQLADAASDVNLDCRLTAGAPVQQADFCTMESAGAEIASFDQVGLDRLSGRTSDGVAVQLLRAR